MANKTNAQKELLKLFRKSLTAVNNLALLNLNVQVGCYFAGNEFRFHITVFEADSNNATFHAYDFQKIEDVKKSVAIVIASLKTDDLSRFKKALERTEPA